jgi:dTDP-4-amino-4,6-dideoxygalactose transaminase
VSTAAAYDATQGEHVTSISFVDLKRQYALLKEEIDPVLLDVVASTQYILGEEVSRFEQEFAAYCDAAHCVGVASGTAALDLAYEAIGLGPDDEVIVPANTFIATVVPLFRLGARPVLVDCDEYGQIDVEQAAAAVSGRTRAVVGVHLYGHPCDADALDALCREHGLTFVEDAAQAHGATYKRRRCGSLGRVAAFSFYPGKNLGAYGDAGGVVTDDPDLAERIGILRDLGQRRKYEHVAIGGNERLDTLQAAVLRVKLRHLDDWNAARRAHAAHYSALLDPAVEVPQVAEWAEPVWHLYTIETASRDEVRAALDEAGIGNGLHYPRPLHLQPALAMLGHREGEFPVAERRAGTLLSLPMFAELRPDEVERVAAVVRDAALRESIV